MPLEVESFCMIERTAQMDIGTAIHADLKDLPAFDVRAAIRRGDYSGHTAGLAPGRLQCNLAIVPEQFAPAFLRFCQRNPKPCPLVGIGESGDSRLPALGHDIDIRSDVPKYRVFRDGEFSEEVTDISAIWSKDMVPVALGCSFTFENAMLRHGIPVRHIETGGNVPMFRTNMALQPAGPFTGYMVVTMRPIPAKQVDRAKEISGRYPQAHGAPVAVGAPDQLDIADLGNPDWGEPVEIRDDEVPVYWACGVTPQNVLLDAKLPICITHSPGHMLISDVAEDAETTIPNPQ